MGLPAAGSPMDHVRLLQQDRNAEQHLREEIDRQADGAEGQRTEPLGVRRAHRQRDVGRDEQHRRRQQHAAHHHVVAEHLQRRADRQREHAADRQRVERDRHSQLAALNAAQIDRHRDAQQHPAPRRGKRKETKRVRFPQQPRKRGHIRDVSQQEEYAADNVEDKLELFGVLFFGEHLRRQERVAEHADGKSDQDGHAVRRAVGQRVSVNAVDQKQNRRAHLAREPRVGVALVSEQNKQAGEQCFGDPQRNEQLHMISSLFYRIPKKERHVNKKALDKAGGSCYNRYAWRVVREVEGAALEMLCGETHLGFESLTLRHAYKNGYYDTMTVLILFYVDLC